MMKKERINWVFNRLRNGGHPQYDTELFHAVHDLQDEVERLQKCEDSANALQRSISEALNSGDGAYRP